MVGEPQQPWSGRVWRQPKPEKLVSRGPSDFFIVGKTHEGQRVEIRLSPVQWRIGGLDAFPR